MLKALACEVDSRGILANRFGLTIAVGVKHRADVGQAVPLGAVLQMHDHQIVANHIGATGVITPHLVVEIGFAIAQGGTQDRGQASRVQHIAARHIQGQAQVEGQARFDLGHALQHFFRGQQVHAAVLVVRAEVAPG
jgi:hypothetical protein